jgi:hypothetical protein
MAAVEIVALQDVLGEQAKLARGPPALALKARFGQAGLLRPDLGDRVGARLDLVGDGVEERGARLAAGIAVAPERRFRRLAGAVDQRGRPHRERMRRPVRRV